MTQSKLILYEIRRLLRKKITWAVMGVMALVPVINVTGLFGQLFLGGAGDAAARTAADTFIREPIFQSFAIGGLAMVVLLLYEMDWARRSNTLVIFESIGDPAGHYARQAVAMTAVTVIACGISLCILYPYTSAAMGSLFSPADFFRGWLYLYFGALVICILLTAGLYMLFNNMMATLVVMGVMMVLLPAMGQSTATDEVMGWFSLYSNAVDGLSNWLRTPVEMLSDGTGNELQFEMILYYRSLWLLIGVCVLAAGALGIRRYGMKMEQSSTMPKPKLVPLAALVLCVAAVAIVIRNEPFYLNPRPLYLLPEAYVDEQTGIVIDPTETENLNIYFTGGEIQAMVDAEEQVLRASCAYEIRSEEPQVQQRLRMYLAPGLRVTSLTQDGRPVAFAKEKYDDPLQERSAYLMLLDPAEMFTLEITYEGRPRGAFGHPVHGIAEDYVDIQSWTPAFSVTSDQKIINDILLTMPEHLFVVSLINTEYETTASLPGYCTYSFQGGGNLLAGRYSVKEFDVDGQRVLLAYFSRKEEQVAQSDMLEIFSRVFQYCQDTFGPLRRGRSGRARTVVMAERTLNPWVSDASGFVWVTETQMLKLDESGNLLAEDAADITGTIQLIASQWWGAGVFERGDQIWTQEGMLEYITYLCMKDLMGEEYAKREFLDKWEDNHWRAMNSFYYVHPEYIAKLPEAVALDVNIRRQQYFRKYQAPLVLLKIQEMVGGEDIFLKKLSAELQLANYITFDTFVYIMDITEEDMTLDKPRAGLPEGGE